MAWAAGLAEKYNGQVTADVLAREASDQLLFSLFFRETRPDPKDFLGKVDKALSNGRTANKVARHYLTGMLGIVEIRDHAAMLVATDAGDEWREINKAAAQVYREIFAKNFTQTIKSWASMNNEDLRKLAEGIVPLSP